MIRNKNINLVFLKFSYDNVFLQLKNRKIIFRINYKIVYIYIYIYIYIILK